MYPAVCVEAVEKLGKGDFMGNITIIWSERVESLITFYGSLSRVLTNFRMVPV